MAATAATHPGLVARASAQAAPGTGTIQGIAVDTSGKILSGVEVTLTDLATSTRTDGRGLYRFDSVRVGRHTLTARKLGAEPVNIGLQVIVNDITYADLVMKPVPTATIPSLAPVTVNATVRGAPTAPQGFLDRMASGQGTFFTESEIAKIRPRRVSDLMRRVPGLKLFPNGEVFSGRGISTIRTEACAYGMPIFVDNVQVGGGDMGDPESVTDRSMNRRPDFMSPTANGRSPIDGLKPTDIAGIEIYNGPSTAPATVAGANSSCGAILIWTK